MSVEEQLAIYRKRKKREEEVAALKHKVWSFFTSIFTLGGKPQNTASDSTSVRGGVEEETGVVPSHPSHSVSSSHLYKWLASMEVLSFLAPCNMSKVSILSYLRTCF